MGPRSRERGHLGKLCYAYDLAIALQWGRAHVSADIAQIAFESAHVFYCFNGAALT